MTYSQPQQPQSNYRPNRAALWVNDRKTAANQPDYKGNIEISWSTFQELFAAFNAGQCTQDGGGQPCIKLDIALYAQQGGVSAGGKNRPIMSGSISSPSEMQQRAAARAAAQQQYAPQYAPQPQYTQPPAPMPQPQYAPQPPAPVAPPQPQYAPEQPAPVQQLFDGPFPAAAPAPTPQQAYQQPPQPQAPAPLAPPPAGVQPMPGAIHAPQPPAAPTPTLPPGF